MVHTPISKRSRETGGRGGPYVPLSSPSLEQLRAVVQSLDEATDQNSDVFTLVESRLLEKRLQALMVPNSAPVAGPVGSGFGFRLDPFNGRAALHAGVVDEDVDGGDVAFDRVDAGLHRRDVADVEGAGVDRVAFGAQRLRRGLEPL